MKDKIIRYLEILFVMVGFLFLFRVFAGPTPTSIFQTLSKSTLKLFSGRGGGSGVVVIYDNKQYVLTAAHVCRGNKEFEVTTYDGKKFQLPVLRQDAAKDLCLLSWTYPSMAYPALYVTGYPSQFEPIYVMGWPWFEALTPTQGELLIDTTLTLNIRPDAEGKCPPGLPKAFAFTEDGPTPVCIAVTSVALTTAPVFPGNSGGPVVNGYGELVGIAILRDERTGWGAIVPERIIKEFLGGI